MLDIYNSIIGKLTTSKVHLNTMPDQKSCYPVQGFNASGFPFTR